jgi:hypothetical protein
MNVKKTGKSITQLSGLFGGGEGTLFPLFPMVLTMS